jgi:hypothetical protein
MTTPHTGKNAQNTAPLPRQDQPNRARHAAIELTEQELKRVVGGHIHID